MKVIKSVIFVQPTQIGNAPERVLDQGQSVEGRPVAISEGKIGLEIDWSTARGVKMTNLVPWHAVQAVIYENVADKVMK